MNKFPPGAIRTVEELKQAKVVYLVNSERFSKYEVDNPHTLTGLWLDSNSRSNQNNLNLGGNASFTYGRAFAFANYWMAYAYKLKLDGSKDND